MKKKKKKGKLIELGKPRNPALVNGGSWATAIYLPIYAVRSRSPKNYLSSKLGSLRLMSSGPQNCAETTGMPKTGRLSMTNSEQF